MTPYKEITPFLGHLAWQCVAGIGSFIFGLAALVWLAAWLSLSPISIFLMWLDGDCPLWGMLLGEAFLIVPAAFFGYIHLMEAWESFLLRRGYTKS